MTEAVIIRRTGGPEVLEAVSINLPDPASGHARLRHTAIGLNFIDVYQRTGAFSLPLPSGMGIEAAGVVEAVGPDVESLSVGDRVAYGPGPLGAYATEANVPAHRLVKLSADVSDELAASAMLKGLTTHMLVTRSFPVGPGTIAVVHAAAGGVGSLLVQWAKSLGATVIGTAGSAAKRAAALELGCDHALDYRLETFGADVKALTGGPGAHVVYDGIGRDTFERSLDALRPFGHFVGFGTASGPIVGVDLAILNRKGSLYASRPSVMHHVASAADLQRAGSELMGVLASGAVRSTVHQRYPLSGIADAHRALEAGETLGSTVILP